jgi:hypothetical protein
MWEIAEGPPCLAKGEKRPTVVLPSRLVVGLRVQWRPVLRDR